MNNPTKRLRTAASLLVLALLLAPLFAPEVHAQVQPTERQMRTYIPPDQLVSFLPSTPFPQVVEFLNPIFERVTGKTIVDPLEISAPIGIGVNGYHFFDAFELVLDYNELWYRETENHFIIEEIPEPEDIPVVDAQNRGAGGAAALADEAIPAYATTREVQIDAILFEFDHTRSRELGIDWNVFFGEGGTQSGTGGTGGGTGGDDSERPQFFLKTDQFFESLEDILDAPDEIELSTLTQFFRLLENEGAGETVASPQVTVQSGEQGRIQIGSDIPVQIRDFSGNTITEFIQTGIIVNVTPTVLRSAVSAEEEAEELDFIHLDVHVEKSSGRPSFQGLAVDRNQATTQVLLLDGEQTVIGGLYSTDESVSRRGIPVLKDLPGWFFGLRYIFGYTQTTLTQKELLIVLQAELLEPLQVRADRPFPEGLRDSRRERTDRIIERAYGTQ